MESYVLYLIKVNVALVVLYTFYKFFLSKDTFFGLKRTMLLLIYIISFVYPFIDFSGLMGLEEHLIGQAVAGIYNKILPEVSVVVSQASLSLEDKKWTVSMWFWIIYGMGIALLLLRTFLELGKIYGSWLRSHRNSLKGVFICQSPEFREPCSFFHWIFINPVLYSDKEINEILIHERTHACEYHSLDILLAQLVIVLCWFNPFAWLIRSEIRMNHEYLADKQVVASGYDKKTYQYHLLGIEHISLAAANLYNNFSVLPLKKRIKMLNRKRTHSIMIGKYLMFIPVVALLIFFSNCANKSENTQPATEMTEAVAVTEPTKVVEPEKEPVETKNVDDSPIYEVVDNMPQFPGGTGEFLKFLSRNIKYPANAEKNKIQGRVVIQFVINKDGSVSDTKIVRSVDPELDAEALRVIKLTPNWKPGMSNGEVVRVKYTVPVQFKLQ